MENWDHIIFPTFTSPISMCSLFPHAPTHNEYRVFYFNSNKGTRKDLSKCLRLKKFFSPLNVQASKKKYWKPTKSISWSDSETLDGKGIKLEP